MTYFTPISSSIGPKFLRCKDLFLQKNILRAEFYFTGPDFANFSKYKTADDDDSVFLTRETLSQRLKTTFRFLKGKRIHFPVADNYLPAHSFILASYSTSFQLLIFHPPEGPEEKLELAKPER